MDDRIQIKVRIAGNSSMWENIEPLPFTVPQRKLNDALSFLSSLQDKQQRIIEFRCNVVGSLQGIYIAPN